MLIVQKRRTFDPFNKTDLEELQYFVVNNRWRTSCPFDIEEPWLEIPAMCVSKLLRARMGELVNLSK